MHEHDAPSWWRTRTGLVFLGFTAIAAFFLITEHRAHLVLAVPYLPWLLLLACPLMMIGMMFMTKAPSSLIRLAISGSWSSLTPGTSTELTLMVSPSSPARFNPSNWFSMSICVPSTPL